MLPAFDFPQMDQGLAGQLCLALASPLWKLLPYEINPNPRTWSVTLLLLRPGHRLRLRITAPWRHGWHGHHPPFVFILSIQHQARGTLLHRHLTRLNHELRQGEREGRLNLPEPFFYDELAHALVYPCLPTPQPDEAAASTPAPIDLAALWRGQQEESDLAWLGQKLKFLSHRHSLGPWWEQDGAGAAWCLQRAAL